MAKPIKETPILKGKDAVIFLDKQKNCDRNSISQAERERMQQNFLKLQSLVVANVSR